MSEQHQDKVNEFERRRLARLEKVRAELQELIDEFSEDSNMSHDISENSARDSLLAKINSKQAQIAKLEAASSVPHIPGTWNLGDRLYVKFLRIVSYGMDKELPSRRIKIELVDEMDITTLDEGVDVNSLEIVPTATNSPMGKALLHKAHDTVRFDTPVGYCEIEVERCLI